MYDGVKAKWTEWKTNRSNEKKEIAEVGLNLVTTVGMLFAVGSRSEEAKRRRHQG